MIYRQNHRQLSSGNKILTKYKKGLQLEVLFLCPIRKSFIPFLTTLYL